MALAVLTARPDLAIYDELVDAADASGARLVIVDALAVAARAWPAGILGATAEVDLRTMEGVLPRVGNWRPESTLAVLEAFEAAGVPSLNRSAAIRRGRDHWLTVSALGRAGIPHPETVAGSDPEVLAAAAADTLGFPCVVKQRRSRQGVGVIRCGALDVLQAVLDTLWRAGDEVIVQRFCGPGGVSRRILVLGGDVIGVTEHRAPPGEFRANAARGAGVTPVPADGEQSDLALAAAAAVGLGFAGVDLLPADGGWVVGEVNPTPGWSHLAGATGAPVAGRLIAALLARSRQR